MRAKTNFAERPQAYEIKDGDAGQKIICFRQNIEEITTEDGVQYTADEYTLTVTDTQMLEKRIADNIEAWREKAMKEDYDRAAAEVRAIRDKLLADSDKEMVLDKALPPAPSGTTFTSWLQWLRDLSRVATNSWATYRKNLRDLPEQPGFPFHIEWPQKPED